MLRIVHIVGARPNFMKAAPVIRSLDHKKDCIQRLIHTGQHYDRRMSELFFEELELPKPDVSLGIGSGTHSEQTGEAIKRIGREFELNRPDIVLVYGDVNSTIAGALVAAKMGIRIGHVEAGLRSFDRTMPEEVNRIVTDQLSDLLFIPSREATLNLQREGVNKEKIRFVGNVMIDTLVRLLPRAMEKGRLDSIGSMNGIPSGFVTEGYALATFHRPSNVDSEVRLKQLVDVMEKIGKEGTKVLFPVHPRTRKRMEQLGLSPNPAYVFLLEPLGYIDFLALQNSASFVFTDSGGVQEETTYLGVSCFTVRPNTERPVTVKIGTNKLVGENITDLADSISKFRSSGISGGKIPELWDGKAGERIADLVITDHIERQ
jgi:UDP-N-acetylglucosamine 2-epimerase (non-hydrolysing)